MTLLAREREQFDKRIHEIDFFRGILIILVISIIASVVYDFYKKYINYNTYIEDDSTEEKAKVVFH